MKTHELILRDCYNFLKKETETFQFVLRKNKFLTTISKKYPQFEMSYLLTILSKARKMVLEELKLKTQR